MKLGLALGSGGAKGLAHLGALEVFTEAGIHFDVVSGTSVGAIVGAVYACGTISEFKEEVLSINLASVPLLLSPTLSLSGFFSGGKALEQVRAYLPIENIEDLPIPFTALSVDLNSGELIRFTTGSVIDAIRASFSIPGVFTPVHRNNRCLVDGALVEPLPIEDTRNLGADFVVAIDLFGPDTKRPLRKKEELPIKLPEGLAKGLTHLYETLIKPDEVSHLIQVIEASLAVSQRKLTELRLKEHPADLLLQPSVGLINTFEFHRAEEGIQRGREAAIAALPRLLEILN